MIFVSIYCQKAKITICVDTCPLNAIKFGKIKELRAKYGHLSQVQGLPDFTMTNPNLVIKPHTGAMKKGGVQA